jgi:divalent metal cation (Fe/Co/Zn/Cd) transporter
MENSARSGLGTRILAWGLLVLVALVALKFAFGIVFGLIQAMFTLAVLAAVALAVIWALRRI